MIYRQCIKKTILFILIFSVSCGKNDSEKILKYKGVIKNPLGMKLVYIKPGTFMMGPKDEFYISAKIQDTKQHKVTLTKGFYMQTTEVTIGQWKQFIKESNYRTQAEAKGTGTKLFKKNNIKGLSWKNPGYAITDNYPVTIIAWNDSQVFIRWINKKYNQKYRLPTEAEWEYTCRAGTKTHFYNGNLSKNPTKGYSDEPNQVLDKIGWYSINSGGKPHPVGLKKPNQWGFLTCMAMLVNFVKITI